ncbi:MAG TPA: hypothetical protein VM490_18895, partial [Armatimonadaceae bacterium]|nr:hypothetical protein [Armatimonadaceae bacterium]
TMQIVVAIQVALFLIVWFASPYAVLPRPGEVLASFQDLWFKQGLAENLATSFKLNLTALAWTTVISLLLSYLTVVPFFRPIVNALSKGRYLSLVGFSLVFTLMLGGGQSLKLALLIFGMTVYFVTSMASVVAAIPKAEFDHARTLRMGEWRVVWEVVILGTADKALEVMRQNAAIGWTLLTMVEGISRAEGGLGNLLLTQQKYFRIADVFAIQITILVLALVQDWFIGTVRKAVCPYADLTLERKEG